MIPPLEYSSTAQAIVVRNKEESGTTKDHKKLQNGNEENEKEGNEKHKQEQLQQSLGREQKI